MKNKWTITGLALLLALVGTLGSCGENTQTKTDGPAVDSLDIARQQKAMAIFRQLPEPADATSAKAVLGKKLYFETALSINNSLSCNSCHMLDKYGVDNLPTSPGHEGKKGDRNSPTVYNASFHLAQFWDGRAANLTEQAKGPILNPVEMGIPDEKTAVARIKAIPEYTALFAAAFPDEKEPITYNNIAGAIAAFEETLITPAPFDAYLAGDLNALTPQQKEGLDLFINKTCISCHMGPGLGGAIYQKFGLVNGPYWDYTHSEKHDRGRAEITKNDGDEYFFKVPSLRNIEKTGPYFHDGSVSDLSEAVKIMGHTQLGQEFTPEEIASLVEFLKSLTGEIPGHVAPMTAMN
ncbi:MAG: cytochrome-c peroxidase [Bacteroidota bacterium]|nr:cytochrome-c peroxidase [Bacteroidota bacterium]MDX5431573.1 cytochrome-c peroxidase [Bacteroidota bacterium]MDX5470293.1 cytochrome-c peroxidase [Bacteroidota bacterium]